MFSFEIRRRAWRRTRETEPDVHNGVLGTGLDRMKLAGIEAAKKAK